MKRKNNITPVNQSFLLKLTKCFTLFLFLFFIALFLLYFFGNFQQFDDFTQRQILYFCSIVLVGLFLFSLAGLIESIVYFFLKRQKRLWIYFGFYLFLVIITPPVYAVIRLIVHLSEGL